MSQFEKNVPSGKPKKKAGKDGDASYERPSPVSDRKAAPAEDGAPVADKKTPGGDEKAKPSFEKSVGGKAAPAAKGKNGKAKVRHPWRVAGIAILCVVVAAAVTLVIAYSRITDMIGVDPEAETPEDIKGIPEYTGEGVIHGLICGIDYDNEEADGYTDDEHIGRTDMILYMRYDTINNKANFLQIPRDVFVGPELETGGTGKINALYYYAEDPNNRMEALSRCIYDQLGLPVDFYVTIDMDAVKEIIDHPPGYISVYVPMDVMDPSDPNAVIPAGWRDFTSSEAEFFLRNRKSPTYNDQGDIMRLQMQQSFYSALYREFKELSPTDLLMWMRVILWRVNTDMDPIQLGGLAQKALAIEGSDITFIRPPVGVANYGTNSVLSFEPEGTAEILNEYFRAEGQEVSAEDLGIYTLPMNVGVSEPNIRSMSDIQSTEQGEADAGSAPQEVASLPEEQAAA